MHFKIHCLRFFILNLRNKKYFNNIIKLRNNALQNKKRSHVRNKKRSYGEFEKKLDIAT